MKSIRARNNSLPISSAVIITKPITGGLHYSKSFGLSGMTGDEYSPRQVTTFNIDRVVFIKDGRPVGDIPWDEDRLREYFHGIGLISAD